MKKIIIPVIFFLVFAACKKNKDVIAPAPVAADIYVAGPAALNLNVAYGKIWKNGIGTTVTDSIRNGYVFSVTGNEADVYMCGAERNTSNIDVAKLWKNGIVTNLSNGVQRAGAFTVAISGTDVYVGGYSTVATDGFTRATLWKNGNPTIIDGSFGSNAIINDIEIVGADVYCAGSADSTGTRVARLWKNGTVVPLGNTINTTGQVSMAVSGTDVYVVYNIRDAQIPGAIQEIYLWKNGASTRISAPNVYGEANAIAVSGSDVYIVGLEKNASSADLAKVWKNGIASSLTNGQTYSEARSVFVKGNDVFICGKAYLNNSFISTAVVWKNGMATNLTDGTKDAFGYGIFVK